MDKNEGDMRMEKFIEISWSYSSRYGNGSYIGNLVVPIECINEVINEKVKTQADVEALSSHIAKYMTVYLGEIEGKHSEVCLRGDEVNIKRLSLYKPSNLDTMYLDELCCTLTEVFCENNVYTIKHKFKNDYYAGMKLNDLIEVFEGNHKGELEELQRQSEVERVKGEITSLLEKYAELTGEKFRLD